MFSPEGSPSAVDQADNSKENTWKIGIRGWVVTIIISLFLITFLYILVVFLSELII